MATRTVLGLDIGGANLKAATADKRAVSVPFPLWKQPDKLPAALAELVAKFPDATELAVTMTGELCDCFETKRAGVKAILTAVAACRGARPVRVWSTDGQFIPPEEANANHLKVAAANWHALATFAGRYAPHHGGLLLDIGSTTTDIVLLNHGLPLSSPGITDQDRLASGELVYTGVKRTPVAVLRPERTAAELFATTLDVYLLIGLIPEDDTDFDTADGRPATKHHAHGRLSRMLGGDPEITHPALTDDLARRAHEAQRHLISTNLRQVISVAIHTAGSAVLHFPRVAILSGAGQFLAQEVLRGDAMETPLERIVSLNDELGPAVSACAPAYAVAVLATEMPE